jgi:hypothetical protein
MATLRIDESRLNREVMRKAELFVASFVDRSVTETKKQSPVRTGHMQRTVVADRIRRTGPWALESGVYVMAHYAAPVHEGARPHVIRPRNARALRFELPNGRVVFARRVNHPGNRPNPFLRNAVHRVASADPRIAVGSR